jgi:hypothetical protein
MFKTATAAAIVALVSFAVPAGAEVTRNAQTANAPTSDAQVGSAPMQNALSANGIRWNGIRWNGVRINGARDNGAAVLDFGNLPATVQLVSERPAGE